VIRWLCTPKKARANARTAELEVSSKPVIISEEEAELGEDGDKPPMMTRTCRKTSFAWVRAAGVSAWGVTMGSG
jgi:hypothetical protein